MPPASVLCNFELAEHFARFIELACIGSITDCEDGFGRHYRPFRGRLGSGVEEVEQYVTQRPKLGENEFQRIGWTFASGPQCRLSQPFRKRFSRLFGSGFHLGELIGVSRMAIVLVRKPGFLSSPGDALFASTVVIWEVFMGNLPF
jgi:hypothetical protein